MKDYEKIRQQVHKKYSNEIQDLQLYIIKQNSYIEELLKQNAKLKSDLDHMTAKYEYYTNRPAGKLASMYGMMSNFL